MDVYSVIITAMLISVIIGILTIIFSLKIKTLEAKFFGIGNMLFSIGLLLIIFQSNIPLFLGYVVQSLFLIIGPAFIMITIVILTTGINLFNKRIFLVIISFLTVLYMVTVYIYPSILLRIVIYSTSLSIICLYGVYFSIVNKSLDKFDLNHKILMGVFIGFGSLNILRVLNIVFIKSSNISVFSNDVFNVIFTISASLFLIAWSLQVLMVMLKKSESDLIVLNRDLEYKVAERTEEIEISLHNLQLAQEKLIASEKFSIVGKLVSSIAHEMNTPLGTAITTMSFLEGQLHKVRDMYDANELTNSEFKKHSKVSLESSELINESLSRVSEIIQTFKLIDSSYSFIGKKEINLKEKLTIIIDSVDFELKKLNCDINLDCDDDLEIVCFPNAIDLIFKNLIVNTLIHGIEVSGKNCITIQVRNYESIIKVKYCDNGIGISKNDIDSLFEPFFTTRKSKGSLGLGLYIVHNLVEEALNGSISYCQSNSGGAQFELNFPK